MQIKMVDKKMEQVEIRANRTIFGTYLSSSTNQTENIIAKVDPHCMYVTIYTTENEFVGVREVSSCEFFEDFFSCLPKFKISGTDNTHKIKMTHFAEITLK